jgi:hypothetical protein
MKEPEIPLFWSDRFKKIHGLESLDININSKNTMKHFRVTLKQDEEKKVYWIPGPVTFGGFWPLQEGGVSLDEFKTLFHQNLLSRTAYKLMEIKLPPDYFYPDIFKIQKDSLIENGEYKCIYEINNHIDLASWSEDKMSRGNRKKINQFKKNFGQVRKANINEFDLGIDVLIENRRSKGLNLSLTKEKIRYLLTNLPQFYTLYLAGIESNICAVALIVSIDKFVDYVLYWGDNLEFRHLSPVTSLFEELVKISITSNKLFLDLGISSLNGEINEGLYRYKKNLGSEDSKKYIFKL